MIDIYGILYNSNENIKKSKKKKKKQKAKSKVYHKIFGSVCGSVGHQSSVGQWERTNEHTQNRQPLYHICYISANVIRHQLLLLI